MKYNSIGKSLYKQKLTIAAGVKKFYIKYF